MNPFLMALMGPDQAANLGAMQQLPAAPPQQPNGLQAMMGQLGGSTGLLGAGLGMLGASYDKNINPWQSALQGMTTMQAMKNRSEMVNMQKDRYALEKAQMENENKRREANAKLAERYKQSLLRQFQSPDSEGGITLSPTEEAKLQAADLAIANGDNKALVGLLTPEKPSAFQDKLVQMGYQPGTPEYIAAARELAERSGTTVNVNTGDLGYKVPANYMLADPSDPSKGVTPIPGGPAENRTVEGAGKETMLQVALSQIPDLKAFIFNQDGSPNRKNIGLMTVMEGGIPMTAGRAPAAQMEVGIQAITRSETGAAMPPEEVQNTRKRFEPGLADSDEAIKIKIQMYEDFLSGNLKLIRQGKGGSPEFDTAAFDAEFERRMSGGAAGIGGGPVKWGDL